MVFRVLFLEWWRGKKGGPSDQEEKLKKLRAQVELLSKQQSACQREDEVVLKRIARWRLRRGKAHRGSCGTLRSLRTWIQFSGDRQKENSKEELQEIERSVPEHQKMQKRSQKLQSLQDKNRKYLKDACACEEEMLLLNREMEERKALFETRFRALSEKSGALSEGSSREG